MLQYLINDFYASLSNLHSVREHFAQDANPRAPACDAIHTNTHAQRDMDSAVHMPIQACPCCSTGCMCVCPVDPCVCRCPGGVHHSAEVPGRFEQSRRGRAPRLPTGAHSLLRPAAPTSAHPALVPCCPPLGLINPPRACC